MGKGIHSTTKYCVYRTSKYNYLPRKSLKYVISKQIHILILVELIWICFAAIFVTGYNK